MALVVIPTATFQASDVKASFSSYFKSNNIVCDTVWTFECQKLWQVYDVQLMENVLFWAFLLQEATKFFHYRSLLHEPNECFCYNHNCFLPIAWLNFWQDWTAAATASSDESLEFQWSTFPALSTFVAASFQSSEYWQSKTLLIRLAIYKCLRRADLIKLTVSVIVWCV